METGKKISTITTKKMSATKKVVDECIVCCEPYNKSSHLPIECEQASCKYKACRECIRSYLLNSVNEPHCMECKTNWSARFMLVLNKSWLGDIYRPHREKLLCDIELSKIAETMPAAERYKEWKKQEQETNELRKQWQALKFEAEKMWLKVTESARMTSAIKYGKENPKEEKKEFFMSCPAVNCNGMLSTQYKCGICDTFACKDCNECIGLSKTDTEHICDPNNVASAQAIKKETKQCPGCHNRIYRVEGCSQMWCTGCHTAFDWNTGKKVESERLHNPHWLEYQRTLNGGAAPPRAPGDVPCGGICSRNQLQVGLVDKLNRVKIGEDYKTTQRLCENLRTIHRLVENMALNQVREIRERLQTLIDFKDQRIKYIIGEMTKEQLSTHIFRNDKIRQKNTEMLNVYELLSAVGIDFFNRLLANKNSGELLLNEVTEEMNQYSALREYCNGLFAIISNTYGMMVPQITERWVVISEKFNSKSIKKESEPPAQAPAPASAAKPEVIVIS
jgi:hypothetical protein